MSSTLSFLINGLMFDPQEVLKSELKKYNEILLER